MATRWLVTGLLVILVLPGCARAGGEAFQPTQSTTVLIPEGGTVGQTVNPVGRSVAAFDFQVATFLQPADPAGVLTVDAVDPVSGDVLRRTTVDPDALGDLAWVSATFADPVTVSDDQAVLMRIGWEGSTPLALLANAPLPDASQDGNDVRAADRVVNDPYRDGQMVVDGRPVIGDLAFRVRGGGGPGAALGQVREVVASAGSRFAAAPAFAVVWLLALVGFGLLALHSFRHGARGQ